MSWPPVDIKQAVHAKQEDRNRVAETDVQTGKGANVEPFILDAIGDFPEFEAVIRCTGKENCSQDVAVEQKQSVTVNVSRQHAQDP